MKGVSFQIVRTAMSCVSDWRHNETDENHYLVISRLYRMIPFKINCDKLKV